MQQDLISIKDASKWISTELKKDITPSNISYLINYGRIHKHGNNSETYVSKKEVRDYYNSYYGNRSLNWKEKLGDDIDWHLSFENYKESETTKHVHRLHPYKGKFIPQLVEYFLDDHTDEFKKEVFFDKDDIILDPFCGSGTTLVQANELGINAIGIDISQFNSLISNVKVSEADLTDLENEIHKISESLKEFVSKSLTVKFEKVLLEKLNEFNSKFFPSPEYKIKVKNKEIDEFKYGKEKEKEFLNTFNSLTKEYNIELNQFNSNSFLDKWLLKNVRNEIDFVFDLIKKIKNTETKKIVSVILSRTIRSCRATTHSDLATLIEPVTTTYYCSKHGKICKPLFSIQSWWERYSKDTLKRFKEFNSLRTSTFQHCFTGDSRKIDLYNSVEKFDNLFFNKLKSKKIKGIFTSPPYVGLIDYHEQHAYAYDLFGFKRRDELEIGPLFNGTGKEAKEKYIKGITEVLLNSKNFLTKNYNVFIVANDKHNLYPIIAGRSGMKIIQQFKRPVLNRSEKDKNAYSESIFHLREK